MIDLPLIPKIQSYFIIIFIYGCRIGRHKQQITKSKYLSTTFSTTIHENCKSGWKPVILKIQSYSLRLQDWRVIKQQKRQKQVFVKDFVYNYSWDRKKWLKTRYPEHSIRKKVENGNWTGLDNRAHWQIFFAYLYWWKLHIFAAFRRQKIGLPETFVEFWNFFLIVIGVFQAGAWHWNETFVNPKYFFQPSYIFLTNPTLQSA